MTNIIFLGVDSEDRARVSEKFPDAIVLAEPLSGDELVSQCKDAEIISVFITTAFPKEVIDQLPNLKLLCTRSVGFNHIDLDACKAKNIIVCHVPDYGSHVIAEHVFALLLGTLRHVAEGDDRVEEGEFDYHGLRGIALKGKTIGVIGTGRIGVCSIRIAHGFGMKIVASDPHPNEEIAQQYGVRYTDVDDLCKVSDIITLHAPAVESTIHILNSDRFAAMKEGVIVVNTARGELIDSDALLDALKSGKVKYALLDVLEHEKNFEENKELIGHPNAITTPHIAFYAEESMRNMYEDCFDSIEEWQNGEVPEHVVPPLQKSAKR